MKCNGFLYMDISNKLNVPYSTVQKWFRKPPRTLEQELQKYNLHIKRRKKCQMNLLRLNRQQNCGL
jgi:transposase